MNPPEVEPTSPADDTAGPGANGDVTLSLVSHTNVGKTTLARTLLRRDVGEVRDQAHVTETPEKHAIVEDGDGALLLWDTPGFGDSARLLKHLRRHDRPLVWFFSQLWDRVTDKPLWSSQQATLNIRDEADVVLYLVNATEEPEDAGYVNPELELLNWLGKPVVVVLNQTSDLEPGSPLMRERLEVWRRHTRRFDVVADVVALDAFTRIWVEEDFLLGRLLEVLPEERRPAAQRLRQLWRQDNLRIFDRSVESLADYLADLVTDRETLSSRRPSKEEKEQAQRALAQRLERSTEEMTRALLMLHGLSGDAAARLEESLHRFKVEGEDRVDPERGAILGSVLSGAVGGLTADILAGGLTFGGGLLAGAILGALGGAGLARGYQLAMAGKKAEVRWTPEILSEIAARAFLRYLAVARFGRGRGEFLAGDEPRRFVETISRVLRRDAEDWENTWEGLDQSSRAAQELQPRVAKTLQAILVAIYPDARDLFGAQDPLEAQDLSEAQDPLEARDSRA